MHFAKRASGFVFLGLFLAASVLLLCNIEKEPVRSFIVSNEQKKPSYTVSFEESYEACIRFPYEDCGLFCSVPEGQVRIDVKGLETGRTETLVFNSQAHRSTQREGMEPLAYVVQGTGSCIVKDAFEKVSFIVKPTGKHTATLGFE